MNKQDWQKHVDTIDNSSRAMPILACATCPQIIRHGRANAFCMAGDEQSGETKHLFIDDEDSIHPECPLPKIKDLVR